MKAISVANDHQAQTAETDGGTRERILAAAWKIIEEKGEAAATMKAVATLTGVSRQAVYLHFSDRSHLLSSVSDYLDEKMGLGGWMKEVEALDDGHAMIRRVAETRAQRSRVIASLVRSVEADRFRDEAAAGAWRRRHQMNVGWVETVIVRKLVAEGRVHSSWDVRQAASLLVLLFSFRTWDDLTQASEWPEATYVDAITSVALSMLEGPARR